MLEFISETAQYGDFVSGPRVINAETKARMKDILSEIQDGTFVQKWVAEYDAGLPNYKRYQQADKDHPIEKVGRELRAKMQWLQQGQASAQASAPAAAAAPAAQPDPIAETA